MLSRIWYKLSTTIIGGAIIVGTASVLSRLLGLVRDRLLASRFGAGDALDAYFAAFKLPDFIFNILVVGALAAAFIPIFLEYWNRDREQAWQAASGFLNLLTLALAVLAALSVVFAPLIVRLIAPGFTGDTFDETVHLTRILLSSVVLFGISNVFSGVLNALRRFVAFSLAPIVYNVGIIIGIVWFVPIWGTTGLAWGVVLGAALHGLVQLPAVLRAGFRWRPTGLSEPVQRILRLMAPRMLGLGVVQVNQVVMTAIASGLAVGSVAVFNLATNLASFPISVFGISLAVSAFPVFSAAVADGDERGFVDSFSKTFRQVLFFIIPVSVAVLLLRAQVVRLILGSGAFDWEDTVLTAQALGFFSLTLFAQSTLPLLARSFFALKDTKTPVIISTVAVVINILAGVVLSNRWGILGLSAAFSGAALVNMLLMVAALRTRVATLDDQRIVSSIVKIIIGSSVAGLVIQFAKYTIAPHVDMQTFVGVLVQTTGALLAGLLVYVVVAMVLRFEEVSTIRRWTVNAWRVLANGRGK